MKISELIRAGVIKRPRKIRRIRPKKPSRAAEVAYRKTLLDLVKVIRKVTTETLLPVLKRTEAQYARISKTDSAPSEYFGNYDFKRNAFRCVQPACVDTHRVFDGFAADIMAAIDHMGNTLGGIDGMALRLAQGAVKRAADAADESLGSSLSSALGIDMTHTVKMLDVQKQIEAATIANTQLIKSIPAQFLSRLEPMILNDVQQGRRYEDLAADIDKLFDVTENRAKVIARDQMSKVNATINEAKQTELGIATYTWSTAGDERVRESHAAHEGQVFSWDDPPADTGHPGEDVMCRCVAIPNIELDDED